MTAIAPPPAVGLPANRWVGIVGRRRILAGERPVRALRVLAMRKDITRLFPSTKPELPWWVRDPLTRQLRDMRNTPTIHAVFVRHGG